ncbi:MAG: hypothetical protein ACOX7Q_14545 [Kiritimatiellia bacterium]
MQHALLPVWLTPRCESVNIVGYNTVTIDKQWTIVAANFEAVGGGAIAIQDAFPYSDGMTKGNTTATADVLQIQNAVGGYDIYYLSNGKNAKGATVAGLDGKWAAGRHYSRRLRRRSPLAQRSGTTRATLARH